MGGVEVQSNTYISFDRVWINHSILVIVIERLIKDDSLTVSLYPSGCREDEAHIEGKFNTCTTVPTQIKPTVNIIRVTSNTTVSIKTNPLTIFVPSAFYLIC